MQLSELIELDFNVGHIVNVLYRNYECGWRYEHRDQNGDIVPRRHSAIYYIADGVFGATVNGTEYTVPRDSIVLFDEGLYSSMYYLEGGHNSTLDVYQFAFKTDMCFSSLGLPLVLSDQSRYRRRFEDAYACRISQSIAHKVRARSQILSLVFELIADNTGSSEEPVSSGRLLSVLEYIGAHYAEQITSDDLCAAGNYSASHLRRLFIKELGMPPMRYVNSLRIRHACELLCDDNSPIKLIGHRVGYDDPSYFSYIFREFVGMTPAEYRESLSRPPIVR